MDGEAIFKSDSNYSSCMPLTNHPAKFESTKEVFKFHVQFYDHLRFNKDGRMYFMLMIGSNVALTQY